MERTRPDGLGTRPDALASRTGADAIPDARGLNLYRADPMADALFGLYLPRPLFEHLRPHLDRLGALAGGPLDELASTADKHPPTLSVRTRRGADERRVLKHPAYVELERVAFCDLGLAAMSHRAGVLGWVVGERGRGFQQMADMVNNSRLSNGVRAAGLMRRAPTEALHVARHRVAFGRPLAEMPLMRRQLAKMALRTEQARTMVFQTAAALERADRDGGEAAMLARIMTPLIKFRACRDARVVTGDAMEVRGGCGYIEEWSDARLLRDAHLGSIWEGTSNIVALDVLRAAKRDGALQALRAHVDALLADGEPCPAATAALQAEVVNRAFALAADAAAADRAELARQAATALYNVTTMAALRWEARRAGLPYRGRLADRVLRHRLALRDPLGALGAPAGADDDGEIEPATG